jgi:hypothetical protein
MAHGYAAPAAVKNALYDVVTRHFNGELDSKAAAQALAEAVAARQGVRRRYAQQIHRAGGTMAGGERLGAA